VSGGCIYSDSIDDGRTVARGLVTYHDDGDVKMYKRVLK
jgi:hypothetical protein